jgi:maltodextrin utilization protein YvdJ
MKKNKIAQEEMIGFVLIMIIVAVIILVFLGFSLSGSKKESVESYETESFMQAVLQYTTDCQDDLGELNIQKLMFECYDEEKCSDERETCSVLDSNLKEMLKESWKTGEESPIKGYELRIVSEEREIEYIFEGENSGNSKGSYQSLSKSGVDLEIFFTVYYS